MPPFYSQAGEDVILEALLPASSGVFAEIGCIDGRRFSNSYHFEQKGWTGLCVEAHPDYLGLLRQNRPRSTIVHAAVAEADEAEVDFYANHRGSLSTLDPGKEEDFRQRFGAWFSGFTLTKVPMRSLSSLIDQYAFTCFDFISVDVEGSELGVLRGIDFSRHRPRILLVEADDEMARRSLNDFLIPHRYQCLGSVGHNLFFAAEGYRMETSLLAPLLAVPLLHTAHPLDQGPDCIVERTVDWQPAR